MRPIHLQSGIVLCLMAVTLFSAADTARAADFTGTNGKDQFFFEGTGQQFTTTLVNPYSGQSIDIDDQFNVNDSTWDGLAGFDILFMTNSGDVLQIRDGLGNQAVSNIEQVLSAGGNDVIHLADATFTLGNLQIDGGNGDDIVWSNVGNDLLFGRVGNDTIDGGPGNDTIDGGSGNDILRGGAGNDTIVFFNPALDGVDLAFGGAGFDTLWIGQGFTLLDVIISHIGGPNSVVAIDVGGGSVQATGIEQLRFNDGSTFLIPEPTTLSLFALGGMAMLRRRRDRPAPILA